MAYDDITIGRAVDVAKAALSNDKAAFDAIHQPELVAKLDCNRGETDSGTR
jgi:hypothetical protein